jgi:hypothetical protein
MSAFCIHVLPIRAHVSSSDSPVCAEVLQQAPIRRIATVIKHVLEIVFLHIFGLLEFAGFDSFSVTFWFLNLSAVLFKTGKWRHPNDSIEISFENWYNSRNIFDFLRLEKVEIHSRTQDRAISCPGEGR